MISALKEASTGCSLLQLLLIRIAVLRHSLKVVSVPKEGNKRAGSESFRVVHMLLEVGNLVNQRPIGRVPNDPDKDKYLFYAELKQSRQNIYSGELGLLQYPGNALLSAQKQNVTTSRPSRVHPEGWLLRLVLIQSLGLK